MARYVTVSSVSHRPQAPYEQIDRLLQDAGKYATRAAHMGADIIAFPEIYPHLGVPTSAWPEVAEPLDGRTVSYMADVARRNNAYIVWPMVERADGRIYNSSVLIDRGGDVVGVYHKCYPTIGEVDAGITPGNSTPVFETDFGRVGLCICFDLNFRPVIEGLARGGAEVIFFSSMYRGGLQLQAWALEFGVYFVSAITAELGVVVDQTGAILAEATYEAVCAQRINLDRRLMHMDYNWQKMDAMLERYGTGVSFRYATREAMHTVASELPDVSIDDMITEFDLESREAYFLRAMRRRDGALPG